MKFIQMGFVLRMSRNLNIWDVVWTKQVQMEQNEVGRWRVGGGLQVPSEIAVHMCGFHGIRIGNYFGGEPIGRTEVEMRTGKL